MKTALAEAILVGLVLTGLAFAIGCSSGPSQEESLQQREADRAKAREEQKERREREERDGEKQRKEHEEQQKRLEVLVSNPRFIETCEIMVGQYLDWVKSGDVDKADSLLLSGKYDPGRLTWLSEWESLQINSGGGDILGRSFGGSSESFYRIPFAVRVRRGYWQEYVGFVFVDEKYEPPSADKPLKSPVSCNGLSLGLREPN